LAYSDDGENLICFREIGIGTSVTNASEQIAQEIVAKLNLNPSDCRFFETYDDESYDEIEYEWTRSANFSAFDSLWVAKNPQWKSCKEEMIKELFNS
jgi:hypothetical protein